MEANNERNFSEILRKLSESITYTKVLTFGRVRVIFVARVQKIHYDRRKLSLLVCKNVASVVQQISE